MDGNLTQTPSREACSFSYNRGSGVLPEDVGQRAWLAVNLASNDPSQSFVVMNVTIYYCADCHGMYVLSE